MVVRDLNAGARPYHHRRPNRPHPSPLQPPPPVTPASAYYYASAGCQPPLRLVLTYSGATFPEHHYPLPQLQPPAFFRNNGPPPPRHHRRNGPRGLTFPNNRGGVVCEKLYAQAMYRYNKARAAAAVEVEGMRAVACGPRSWTKIRGKGKAYVPVARAGRATARSPSPAFTTRPETWIPPPAWLGRTTVMIRNIPNKLTRAGMMELLDDHCARENRRRRGRGRAAAYDFLYVPMDFRHKSSNKGYAFVNFTTADAARGLHYALHGCGWRPWVGSYKTIDIAAARIQEKRTLVRRFTRSTFACHSDEFLPAVFWPPRDGGATDVQPRLLGRRIPPVVSPVQQQPQAVAPAQAWMPVRVEAS